MSAIGDLARPLPWSDGSIMLDAIRQLSRDRRAAN
jgi:hypothetical protein